MHQIDSNTSAFPNANVTLLLLTNSYKRHKHDKMCHFVKFWTRWNSADSPFVSLPSLQPSFQNQSTSNQSVSKHESADSCKLWSAAACRRLVSLVCARVLSFPQISSRPEVNDLC